MSVTKLREISYYKSPILPEFNSILAIDIEKVRELATNRLYCGWVVITAHRHQKKKTPSTDIIYSSFVYFKINEIDLMTRWSGLTAKQILNGQRFEQVQKDVEFFLTNYKIVGADVRNDLFSLNLERFSDKCIDIHKIFRDKNDQPIGLKVLAIALLNKRIQEYSKNKRHDPIIDSICTLKIYKRYLKGIINPKIDELGKLSYDFCRELAKNKLNN